MKKNVEIWMAPKPFAKGSMRYAFAGYLGDGTGLGSLIVILDKG